MNTLTKTLLFIIIIETATLLWFAYDRTVQSIDNKQLTENLEKEIDEKDAVQLELQNMLEQYESIKTNNQTLNQKLEKEQERIIELMTKLKSVKRNELYKIKELQKEAETLRNIMKSYVKQIDSLNTRNKILINTNRDITQRYELEKDEKNNLIVQRDSLTNKVKQAAILETSGINILALNKKGKETSKAKKLTKFKACFTLEDNIIARRGTKNVYIRIAGPDNMILRNDESGFFMFNGKEIAYSAKRVILYNGDDMNVCMYWLNNLEQPGGNYSLDIFVDGYNIGKKTIKLK